jgi:hypothetical protein
MLDQKIEIDKNQELYNKMTGNNVHISYTGAFDGQILSVIAKNIEYSLSQDPIINKKMFKVFLELAQNISYYSAEQKETDKGEKSGVGTIVIQEFNNHYVFATGNIVKKSDTEKIEFKCTKINSLSRDDLRKFKREQRKLPAGERGGGNIGLIQVALTSENPIDYKVIPIDESTAFYIVATKVDKI